MPNRILREGIIESERVNALSPQAELFYRRLMSKVDDFGRFHGNLSIIRAACYPLQLDRVADTDISAWLDECASDEALVTVYQVDGKRYIQINNFGQRLRNNCAGKFPAPDGNPPHSAAGRGNPPQHAAPRGNPPQLSAQSESESESYSESYSETETEAESDNAPPQRTENPHAFSDWFEWRYAKHPKKGHRGAAERYASEIPNISDPEVRARFDRKHDAWCGSEGWKWKQGARAPYMDEWILDRGYEYDPPTDVPEEKADPTLEILRKRYPIAAEK